MSALIAGQIGALLSVGLKAGVLFGDRIGVHLHDRSGVRRLRIGVNRAKGDAGRGSAIAEQIHALSSNDREIT